MVNNQRGLDLLERVKEKLYLKEYTLIDATRHNIHIVQPYDQALGWSEEFRKEFYEDLQHNGYCYVVKKYINVCGLSLKSKIERRLGKYWNILRQMSFASVFKTIRYNYLISNVKRDGGRWLIFRGAYIQMNNTARVFLYAPFTMGARKVIGSSNVTKFQMDKWTTLVVNGKFHMNENSNIWITHSGKLILNGGFINENVTITCAKQIIIGKTPISHVKLSSGTMMVTI